MAESEVRVHVLKRDLQNVECWNFSNGRKDLVVPAGTRLQVQRHYDRQRMRALIKGAEGEPDGFLFPGINADGSASRGYVIIADTADLSDALGLELTTQEYDDFLDLIMAHETVGLTPEDEARMFADPRCRQLQGYYSSRCTAP